VFCGNLESIKLNELVNVLTDLYEIVLTSLLFIVLVTVAVLTLTIIVVNPPIIFIEDVRRIPVLKKKVLTEVIKVGDIRPSRGP